MRNKETSENAKIKQAYVNAVPDICDVILSDCEKGKGTVVMMAETKKKKSIVKYMMAAAGMLVVLGAGTLLLNSYQVNYKVASTISLEVNPSIQIMVNEKERVLEVKALNKDGAIVVGDMDFSGSDIDVTVNALIGSMLRNGYLNELANSILISVDNDDPVKGGRLQEKLTEEVNQLLEADGFFGAVLGQTLMNDNTLQQQADRYGITTGKAQLIQQILDSTTGHTFEELAPLSINELNLIIASGAAEMEKVSTLGNASDKAYIGEEKAKEAAFAHAGVAAGDVIYYEMDMDVEKGVMVYEIDFKCGGYEYEYDVNARTGDIVKNKKEIDDDMPRGTQSPSGGTGTSGGTAQAEEGAAGGTAQTGAGASDGTAQTGTGTADGTTQTQTGTTMPSDGTQTPAPPAGSSGTYYHPEQHHEDYHHGSYAPTQGGSGSTGTASGTITLEQAKEIALNHAGLTADAVYFEKAKLDYDDGMQIYEVEFISGNVDYEYEIDALTGAVWDYEWDYD